jgi:putative oxidoreductase
MFCWAMLLLVFTGSGALGLDRLFTARGASTGRPAASASAGEREPAAA